MMDMRLTIVFALVLALTTVQVWQAEIEFAGEITSGDSTTAIAGRAVINRWTPDRMMTIECSIGGVTAWRAEAGVNVGMTIYWPDGSRQELDLPPGFLDGRGAEDLKRYVAGLVGVNEDVMEHEVHPPLLDETDLCQVYAIGEHWVWQQQQSTDVDERGLPRRLVFTLDENWRMSADFNYIEIK